LIAAYLGLGALLQLLTRDLSTGLGLAGLIVSPAFGYAGVGFPLFGMNAFAHVWSSILPLRWYMAVLLGQAARGLPVHDSAPRFVELTGLAAIYVLLAIMCLKFVGPRMARREAEPEAAPPVAASHGLVGAFAAEWRRVLTIHGAFILLIIAPLVYSIYY